MAEIIKEWLTDRLKRPIKWETQGFGKMMRSGHIVASLLHSYNVINEEKLLLIRHSDDMIDIINNWQYLRKWLQEVDVYLTDKDHDNIMEGLGSAFLSLFYQLFLQMDKRDRTNFIKEKLKTVSALAEKLDDRFNADKIKDKEEQIADYLNNPLLNEVTFNDWQRKKSNEVKETYDFIRQKYGKTLEKIRDDNMLCGTSSGTSTKYTLTAKEKSEMEQFDLKHSCKYDKYTYDQLLTLNNPKPLVTKDTAWSINYMNDLFEKLNKRSGSEEFMKARRRVLKSRKSLDSCEENSNLETDITEKIMKSSEYEKQMCTRAMKIKQQSRNIMKGKIDADKQFSKQREKQFNHYIENLNNKIQKRVEKRIRKKRQNSFPH